MRFNTSMMTTERYERLSALFAVLSELPPAGRARELSSLAEADPELAALLERMLAMDEAPNDADDPLGRPIANIAQMAEGWEKSQSSRGMPDAIGPYRVISELGRGSVGDVYLATQAGPVERQVAVKVLQLRHSELLARRFDIEAKVLATLSHPGIAQVFSAGVTDEGRPYLVMEFIDGKPIDEACRESALDEQAIFTLFIELCDAVQHAHHRSIIHRDLKPRNVLVVESGDERRAKIIDFGIAKLADETGAGFRNITQHGQILGTLEYMSPEQWRGERADTRCDVYALGVMLYQLLTNRSPFGSKPGVFPHRADRITSIDSMPEVSGKWREDVEMIIGKAVAHEVEARYSSPQHLAEDVGRLLRGEPVLVVKPSLLDRAVKLARRQPLPTALTGIIALMVITLAGYIVTTRQHLAGEVEMQRGMIVAMLDDAIDQLHNMSGALATRRAIAETLLHRTEQLLAVRPNDLVLLESKARLLMEIGDLEHHVDLDAAQTYFAEAVAMFEMLAEQGLDSAEFGRRHAKAIVRYGDTVRMSDFDEGLEWYQIAKTMHLELAERYPEHLGVLDDLTWSYDRISAEMIRRWKHDAASVLIDKRLELSERLLAMDPDRTPSLLTVMLGYSCAAENYARQGNVGQKLHMLEEALPYGEELILREPASVYYRIHTASILLRLGRAAATLGNVDDAHAMFARLDALTSQLLADNPTHRQVISTRIAGQFESAYAMLKLGDMGVTRRMYEAAIELADQHPDAVTSRCRRLTRRLESGLTEHNSQ